MVSIPFSTALTLLSFYLPPESGERLTLVITNLLALTVFMLLVVEIIPVTSETVPLISIYFYGSVFEVAMALVATCVVLKCYFNNPSHTPVPNWVRHVVLVWMARLTRVPVKRILHGVDPKDSSHSTPTTDENGNLETEAILPRKIPNIAPAQMPSTQHLHLRNSEQNLHGELHHHLNLSRAKQIQENRYSMPPIFDNLTFKDGLFVHAPSRGQSRINIMNADSQPNFNKTKPEGKDKETDQVSRNMLETQEQIAKDVAEMVRYIQEQEKGELLKEEWQLIAAIIDKFFLWFFLFVSAFSTVVIFLQAPSYAWQ